MPHPIASFGRRDGAPSCAIKMTRMNWIRPLVTAVCALLCLVIAGCGGGGGGSNDNGNSSTPLPVAPRTGAPGQTDARFGQSGMFVFPAGAISSASGVPDGYSMADFTVQLESGKLLVSGLSSVDRVDPFALRVGLLVRLLPDGSFDRSFLGTGFLDFSGSIVDFVLATRLMGLPGDQAVWAHFTEVPCGSLRCPPPGPDTSHLFARRLSSAGIVDPAYGISGTVSARLAPSDAVLGPDGSIVVLGVRTIGTQSPGIPAVDAFDANGKPVEGAHLPSPQTGVCSQQGTAPRAAREPNGKVVAVWTGSTSMPDEICVVRLDGRGSPDPSFGDGGFIVVRVAGIGRPVAILARQDGGSIGVFRDAGDTPGVTIVVWLTAEGTLDMARGNGGSARQGESGIFAVTAVALQPDEKILIAGATRVAPDTPGVPRIARLDRSGELDCMFGPALTGFADLAVAGHVLDPGHILVAPDWSLFVSGSTGKACPLPPAACDPQRIAVMKLIGGDR
jgi:uncharacterized delta-60 repeat protein